MTTDLSNFLDFMDDSVDADGFSSPPMPSAAYPDGHSYHIPSPDAEVGMRLNALADITLKQKRGLEVSEADIARLRLDGADEREFMAQVLTEDILEQMIADGVKWEHMRRLATYGFTYFAISPDAANEAAEAGLFSGKALAPTGNRAARRATTRTTPRTTSVSAASKTTRAPRKR